MGKISPFVTKDEDIFALLSITAPDATNELMISAWPPITAPASMMEPSI